MTLAVETIGRGVNVSPLGFGGAPLGNLYAKVSEDEAQAALESALNAGIRYFDTAPFYGHGLSEERIGRALAGQPRDSYALSTKVGRLVSSAPGTAVARSDGDPFAVAGRKSVFDYSGDGVQRSFEASLERLGVSRIDILFLHDIGRLTHGERHEEVLRLALNEALPAMARLRDSGAVKAIGLGVNEQEVCLEVLPHFKLDCVMLAGRYTLLEQQHSAELLAYARTHGVQILVAGAYNSGLLGPAGAPGATYNYVSVDAPTLERARRLYAECAREAVDVGAVALQFPLAHPAVAGVVAGLRSREEVAIAVNRMKAPIPARLWQRLKQVGLLPVDALVPEGSRSA
jgi:D-threo-aldose 1-dehydrogenase